MPIEPKWKADFAAEVGAAFGCIACCQFQTVMRRTRTKRRIDDFLHDVALRRNDGCRRNDADSETAAPMTWPWWPCICAEAEVGIKAAAPIAMVAPRVRASLRNMPGSPVGARNVRPEHGETPIPADARRKSALLVNQYADASAQTRYHARPGARHTARHSARPGTERTRCHAWRRSCERLWCTHG